VGKLVNKVAGVATFRGRVKTLVRLDVGVVLSPKDWVRAACHAHGLCGACELHQDMPTPSRGPAAPPQSQRPTGRRDRGTA
jgi:hypothetical protein